MSSYIYEPGEASTKVKEVKKLKPVEYLFTEGRNFESYRRLSLFSLAPNVPVVGFEHHSFITAFWTWNSIPIPTSTRVARIIQIPSTVSFSQGMREWLKALFWLAITPKHGPFNQYPLVFCSGSCYLDQGRLASSSASFPVLTCLAAVSWWVDWRWDSTGNNGMPSFFLLLSTQPHVLFLLCGLSMWSFQ